MSNQIAAADHAIGLMTLWMLRDKGLVSTSDIVERLRQTKEKLHARYGEGEATAMLENSMRLFADNQSAEVVPLR